MGGESGGVMGGVMEGGGEWLNISDPPSAWSISGLQVIS